VRKPLIVIAGIVALGTLSYCGSSKKATAAAKPVIAYSSEVAPIIEAQCAPCHFPAKKGNKKPLDTYAALKENIDEVLVRIQLDSTNKKVMPKMKPHLDEATIALIKNWKESGMMETKP